MGFDPRHLTELHLSASPSPSSFAPSSLPSSASAPIFIYQDYVHNTGGLWKALTALYGVDAVRYVDADDIRAGALDSSARAFFMPGGASRYVAAKLGEKGNARIRDYVAAGGVYVGICAGAYYGCSKIEWARGRPDAIAARHGLGFYKGTAVGPVPGLNVAEIVDVDGSPALYWGGPLFEPEVDAKSGGETAETVARYTGLPGKPAAAVQGRFGAGRYLLISPHLEIDAAQLERIRFDVADNRFAEVSSLDGRGLSLARFAELLAGVLGEGAVGAPSPRVVAPPVIAPPAAKTNVPR